ncbi:MAG: hypothetical protein J6X07_02975 [Prevotella sp.]|jgi:hypothetical protein|nr:hypothetical protein [Prevotella sp.]
MKKLFLFILGVFAVQTVLAQTDETKKYMRGSLCMMMVEHPTLEYNKEIEEVFEKMDIPERFNSHDLGVRIIRFSNDKDQQTNVTIFAKENQLGKKFVSKWFGRNKKTGGFNIDLVKERGNYNATKIDVKEALRQHRGLAILEDAGENLIGHTYWVVNDIKYVNQNNFFQGVKDVANLAISGAQAASTKGKSLEKAFDNKNAVVFDLLEDIKGFRVKITSYLFRLKWNEEIQNTFYNNYYTDEPEMEPDKVKGFVEDKDLFSLEYIGSVTNTSSKTSVSGVTTNEKMIRKVCTRALDKNVADLQHDFADFRIKAPLISTDPLKAYVGMKEDITEKSRYEVLVEEQDERGVTIYKRVGIIKPIPDKIWDNRYMAAEEGTRESKLDATYFEKVSGGEFYSGYLIREIK